MGVKRAAALLLVLAGCHRAEPAQTGPGAQLERAAVAAGLVPDARRVSLTGAWARDTDHLCIVPAAGETRIGSLVDYGDGQACAAAGTMTRHGDRLAIRFDDACRFDARFDGERISFPATLPEACERYCSGRATLEALTAEQQSGSVSEASLLRPASGPPLCG